MEILNDLLCTLYANVYKTELLLLIMNTLKEISPSDKNFTWLSQTLPKTKKITFYHWHYQI